MCDRVNASVPCRTCGGLTTTGLEFCSPGCAEEYAAATAPCPDCGHVGWDCICHDEYVPTAEDYEPEGFDSEVDFDPYAGEYDDGRYDEPDCPW